MTTSLTPVSRGAMILASKQAVQRVLGMDRAGCLEQPTPR
jgi:hypothetical protein